MKPLTLHCRITDAEGRVSAGAWQIGPGAEWLAVDGYELAAALRAAAERLEMVIGHIEAEAAFQRRVGRDPQAYHEGYGADA